MKNRPLRHKETNTFKFQSFSERINSIKVDVFHNVKHKYEEESEESTFLFQTLDKWLLLNCSESFNNLREEIGYNIRILPQVVAQKDRLVDLLKKHLENKNPYTLQPVLELMSALAKDLRQDFYPYFDSVYELLVPLLSTKSVDQLEWTFQCLAYLFKFLWRYLVNNFNVVFDSLLPLLSSTKPYYINNFAAQSFAFVARKFKDNEKLLKLILRSLKKSPDSLDGCGRLLFEVIRGVPGQFHSCAEKTLKSCFSSLEDDSYPYNPLCQLLSTTVNYCSNNIQAKHISLLWNILKDSVNHFYSKWREEKSDRSVKNVNLVMEMLHGMVSYKNCVLLTDHESLVDLLLDQLTSKNQINDEITQKIYSMLSIILLSVSKLSQETSSKIVVFTMNYLGENDFMNFVLKIMNHSSFEGLVLPRVVKFCVGKPPMKVLPMLTKLVVSKRPQTKNIEDLLCWTPYTLDFTSYSSHMCQSYLDYLENPLPELLNELDSTISILKLLPNLLPIKKGEAIRFILIVIHSCCQIDETDPKVLTLLSASLETLILLKPPENLMKICPPEIILDALLPHADQNHPEILRVLDFYISMDELNLISLFYDKIKKSIIENLVSPYQKVREYTLHILYEMEKSLEKSNEHMVSLLEISWRAEMIPASLADYRNKIRELQKLSCTNESVNAGIVNGELDYKVFLKLLIGNLYVNFKLIWDPVSKIIVTYAETLKANQFWSVFGEQVDKIGKIIRENSAEPKIESPFIDDHLSEAYLNSNSYDEKPDHINHRILLWNILSNCVVLCDSKNKDVTNQFLTFMEEEYLKRNSEAAFTWDISKKDDAAKDETILEMDVEEQEEKEAEENDEKEAEENDEKLEEDEKDEKIEEKDPDRKFKGVTKSLLAQMETLGKMKTLKQVPREKELSKIYYDFLSHKLPDVQKAALDCIMAYKQKSLTPYRDNLYGIIDDKTFKKELAFFKLDSDSEVIKKEHRPDLIPIVLRIMHSKLYQTGSKNVTKHQRKATVVRFLAGCKSEELSAFFKMAFALLHEVDSEKDILKLTQGIIQNIDLHKMIPPKRLQSSIYLLNTLLIYCGGLLDQGQLSYLLRILVALMSNVTGVLKKREHVFPGYIKVLRNIRNLCFEGLKKFFSNFENYPWSKEEIDAIFECFIWPYLPSMASDSLQSPSSILKLLFVWSKNARFFILLGKTEENRSPLSSIMEVWSNEKIHGSVSNLIMELVESLLTLQDFERFEKMDGDFVEPISINSSAFIDHESIKMIKTSENLNYGSKLLIPFINTILEKLQKKLESKSFAQRDSEVMSRISELVSGSDSSEKLLTLLFPNLIKKSSAEEDVIVPLLTTVYNLIKNVENCGKYVLKLAPLFSSVGDVAARKLLFSIVVELSKEKGSESGLDAKLLDDLNAWDKKFVEHPDFARRLEAFMTIQNMIEEKNMSVNLGVIIIYTCFHFMKTEKDLSMRAHAKNCLEKICPFLCLATADDAELKNAVLNDAVLGQIKKGIVDENDNVRDDCISLLGHMARECTEYHIIFKDLSHLTNKADLEVDFFENIKHLQLHRRVRAMLKFSNLPQVLEEPISTRSITQFVLPIVSHYLLSKRYSNKNTIVDSAIAAVGTACKFLPWHQYNIVLASYLKALQNEVDFQKQLVRILVEILNAFHFDLSQADLLETSKSENTEIEKDDDDVKTVQADKLTRLPKDAANNIVRKIHDNILPQLHTILTRKTQSESSHKLSSKSNDNLDDELILRIPLTVAVVKLLQKLPSKELLDRNIIGVFMKLCTYLKSRVDSVRRVTRETMQTIMISLGPKYLKTIVREMSGILTRGFHLHVLAYSVHSILVALKPSFKKGDIDSSVSLILQVCKSDLFGGASEEKEVNQIAGKVLEARSTKSFDILNILATYVTDSYLLDLIIPLKEELSRTLSHKTVTKIETCFKNIVLGFTLNEYLEATSLLQLSFGCASESISVLTKGTHERKVDPKTMEYESRKNPDIYLIPSDPRRKKAADTKVCSRTNAHLLVEFGFNLLLFLLKRSKVDTDAHKPHLDPFVDLLLDCIKSQHIKIATLAVKCLTWCLRMDLPSIRTNIDTITEMLFEILHKYGSAGLTKGDNFDLVMATFKAVAVIVRDVKYHKLNNDHKRALLLYCEQDLDDRERQATAFSLIHAILSRKIEAPELDEVMKKVSNLSITSNIDSVRQQCLSVMIYYLKEYGLKSANDKLVDYLAFYFSQLSFAYESGRNSALELIKHIINNFPEEFVNEQSAVIFVNVSTRLVNDSSPSFREKSAEAIRILLSKIDNNSKEKLFDVTKVWFAHKKVAHKRLAAQLVGLFVQVEKADFQKRLVEFLPLVTDQFVQGFAENQPGNEAKEGETKIDIMEKLKDHFLFQVLSMLVKICSACSKFLKDPEFTSHLETIAEYTTGLLSYPHEWVRKCAVQLLNTIVRTVPASEIAAIANDPELEKEGFLLSNTKAKLKSLILDLIAQLVPSENSHEQYLLQCMKLLVYLACVVKDVKNEEDEKGISLNWMVRRIRKSLNYEVVQHPSSTIVRSMVFNWTAAISVKLSKDELLPIAPSILMPLLREMNLDDTSLKKVAKDAANCVKNKIGAGEFDAIVATLTTQLEVKKAEKKKQRSQLLVTNPEIAAKKKIHKQQKKKVAKKRKLASLKNHTFKKKPRREANFEDM